MERLNVELLGGDEVEFLRWDRKSEILAWQKRVGKDRTYFLWLALIAPITPAPPTVRPARAPNVFDVADRSPAGETGAGGETDGSRFDVSDQSPVEGAGESAGG
jgi:hypothetical protein